MLDNRDNLEQKTLDELISLLNNTEGYVLLCSISGRIFCCSAKTQDLFERQLDGLNLNEIMDDKSTAFLISNGFSQTPQTIRTKILNIDCSVSLAASPEYMLLNIVPLSDPAGGSMKIPLSFASFLEYEMREPISSMFSVVSRIKSPDLSPDKREKYMAILNNNINRLFRLTRNVADCARFENNAMVLNLEEHDIIKVLRDTFQAVLPYAEKLSIPIELDIPQICVPCLCDKDQIERMLLNILSNSIKYTREGNKISVSANLSCNSEYITIKIIDRGQGINPKMLPFLFHKHASLAFTPLPASGGAGLGLTFVNAVAKLHGGSVMADSLEGRGTAVTVTLSLQLEADAEAPVLRMPPIDYKGGLDSVLLELSTVLPSDEYK